MYELMIYSLKVGVCLAVFYLFFKLLLSRETFHRLNRIVVLGVMLLSFVLPLCEITIYRELPVQPEMPETMAAVSADPSTAEGEPFAWDRLAGVLFLAGAAVTLAGTLRSLAGVMRLVHRGRREKLAGGAVLVLTPQAVTPFSWGRYIVLSEEDAAESGREIILHEQAHMRLHHTWDLLVTDIAGCLQWFNPAMWLLRRELRAIHEYEADEAVLDSGVDARQYQLLLIKKAAGRRWYSIANSFNHSKLKNRITMMLRRKSSRWAQARILLVLPLTALALGSFARTAYVLPEDKVKKENVMIRVSGMEISEGNPVPVYVVDGRVVASIDDIDTKQIASIEIHKDSAALVQYGEQGRNGVVYITLKKEHGASREGTETVAIMQNVLLRDEVFSESDDADVKCETVVVLADTLKGRTVRLKNATIPVDASTHIYVTDGVVETNVPTAMPDSLRGRVVHIKGVSSDAEQRIVVIDGRIRSEQAMNAISPDQIASVSVAKDGDGTSRQVIEVRTKAFDKKQKEQLQTAGNVAQVVYGDDTASADAPGYKAAVEQSVRAAQSGIEAGAAGIEAARKALEASREYMDPKAWDEAQKGLDEARKQLDAAGKQTSSQIVAARKIAGMQSSDKPGEIVVVGYGPHAEKSGKGGPDPLWIIDGKVVKESRIRELSPADIDHINVLKDVSALKKYGKKARNGVVEVFTKKKK